MKVRIPIFTYTEDAPYNVSDIDTPLDECVPVDMIFYQVDNLSVWYDQDHKYCALRSGGDIFISPLRIYEVEKLIDNARQHELVLN